MTVLVVSVLLVLAVAVWRRRRFRRELAGRLSGKPTFMVEPPGRRVGSRRRERL